MKGPLIQEEVRMFSLEVGKLGKVAQRGCSLFKKKKKGLPRRGGCRPNYLPLQKKKKLK